MWLILIYYNFNPHSIKNDFENNLTFFKITGIDKNRKKYIFLKSFLENKRNYSYKYIRKIYKICFDINV